MQTYLETLEFILRLDIVQDVGGFNAAPYEGLGVMEIFNGAGLSITYYVLVLLCSQAVLVCIYIIRLCLMK